MLGFWLDFLVAVRGFFVRTAGYTAALAAVAAMVVAVAAGMVEGAGTLISETPERSGWADVARPAPAFSLISGPDNAFAEKDGQYSIQRHSDGGRRDRLIWSADGQAVAMVEVLRPAAGAQPFGPPAVELASLLADFADSQSVQPAGRIATKFGPMSVYSFLASRQAGILSCLGFAVGHQDPAVQVAGWACPAGGQKADRQALACALDRLTLLKSGGDSSIAGYFARTELRRTGCEAQPATQDWIAAGDVPRLRGAMALR